MSTIRSLHDTHTFENPREWVEFEQRLLGAIRSGLVTEIEPFCKVLSSEERWFRDTASGELYRYAPPEPGAGGGIWLDLTQAELDRMKTGSSNPRPLPEP